MKFRNLLLILLLAAFTQSVLAGNGNSGDNYSEENDSVRVFATVEQMPSFPGGDTEAMRFVIANLRIPESTVEDRELGDYAAVRFVVDREGLVKEPEIARGHGTLLADSLVEIVKRMPRWIPGKQNGREVDVYYTLPLRVSWNISSQK